MSTIYTNTTCKQCGLIFSIPASIRKHGRGKYCSTTCQYDSRRGVPNLRDFKGDAAAYPSVHDWVRRNWGAAKGPCSNCGKTEGWIEWANLDHEYRRVREEWSQMCRSCHRKYDIDAGIMGKRFLRNHGNIDEN